MMLRNFIYLSRVTTVTKLSNIYLSQPCRLKSQSTTISSTVHQKVFNRNQRYFSRYSASTIMSGGGVFNIDDYDIIGFDLDNTLACYNLPEMIKMEYEVLTEYLVHHKNYPKEILKPIGEDMAFLQKGLLLDADRGNILKIGSDGTILKAAHGTRFMNNEEISNIYSTDKYWDIASQFVDDPLSTWNGPPSEKMRSFLDYFDIPAALVVARIVDLIDKQDSSRTQTYKIWPDVLDGLVSLYRREAFAEGTSQYFEELKSEPERYVMKISPRVIDWLKELKKKKAIYLLTGSNIDFSELVASNVFGPDWKNLFDVVITYARKPGFFTQSRQFYEVSHMRETVKINSTDLKLNNVYSQGNWNDLRKLLKQKFKIRNPQCLYVGDNLIQDIYTPFKYANCDTISVVNEILEEQRVDEMKNATTSTYDSNEYNKNIISSNKWESYFGVDDKSTVWTDIILNYSKICIPKIDCLAEKPMNHQYVCFSNDCTNFEGFHPSKPQTLRNISL